MLNAKGSEKVALVATIDPDVHAAGAVTSDYVDMGQFESVMAIISAGTLGASATLDAKLVQATDSSGTGVKDVTGKAITQMTQAGTDQSDTQATIDMRAEEIDMDNDFTHVALIITVAVATSDTYGEILGFHSRSLPATADQLASVGENV
jgi:hypothetical protein